eukprot:6191062-Pleurochrysis_carterae.AAC.3
MITLPCHPALHTIMAWRREGSGGRCGKGRRSFPPLPNAAARAPPPVEGDVEERRQVGGKREHERLRQKRAKSSVPAGNRSPQGAASRFLRAFARAYPSANSSLPPLSPSPSQQRRRPQVQPPASASPATVADVV